MSESDQRTKDQMIAEAEAVRKAFNFAAKGAGFPDLVIEAREDPQKALDATKTAFLFEKCMKKPIPVHAIQIDTAFFVDTKEGRMEGKAGDYLMMGIEGERYPCDKAIFEKSYDWIKG